MPLKRGKQFVFEGFTIEENVTVPHRVVITVTWNLDYCGSELIEADLAFFPQDICLPQSMPP